MRHDHAGEHARQQQHEQHDRQPDAEGQRLHHAGGPAAVAYQAHQGDAEARHHGQQGDHDQELDEPGSLHGNGPIGWFSIDRVLASLAGIALILLFTRLGVWQLQRAEAARSLQAAVAAQAQAAPLELAAAGILANADTDALAGRRVTVRGRWENRYQVLLDNQVAAGQAGYFVYTPLRVDGCACAVLVNRGWVPVGPDRGTAPAVELAPAVAAIEGAAAPPPPAGVGVRADRTELLAPGLLRVQRLDPAGIAKWLDVPVLPLTVRLDPRLPDGYLRAWAPPPGRAARHEAYAAQWFLLALLVPILLIGLNSRGRRESNRIHPQCP